MKERKGGNEPMRKKRISKREGGDVHGKKESNRIV
jgi:hypothetical protein